MSRTITIAGYLLLAAMIIVCETVARRTDRVATFARALGAFARWRLVWLLVLAGWFWVGWHLFVRVRR